MKEDEDQECVGRGTLLQRVGSLAPEEVQVLDVAKREQKGREEG